MKHSKNITNSKNQQDFPTQEYIEYLKSLHQDGPHLGNQYLEDSALQSYIKQIIPQDILEKAEKMQYGLIDLGDKVTTEIKEAGDDAEQNPPKLLKSDAFGQNIDQVVLANGWRQQRKYAALYHIVGGAYNSIPELRDYQRLIQLVKLYLYHPSSGMFSCPLAMTDGCAFVLKSVLENNKNLEENVKQKVQKAYNHLISNDPQQFWTSGQWMTEKRGGSDIKRSTETIAIPYKPNKYKLYGYKFFCSAADCNIALVLARINSNQNLPLDELRTQPISLFLLKLHKKNKQLNNLEYICLKEKLGTRQLPTAELVLNGAKATLISPPGQGIKYISNMLYVTRLYNSGSALGTMRRMIALCRDYQQRREVFEKKLSDHPMQQKLMADMEVIYRANLIFYLKQAYIFNKEQLNQATEDEKNISRLFSPLLKLFSAKELQKISSESIEIFGGLGYCENSKLPTLFRDGQVLSIWEGTTNILSLDFYRALQQKNNPISSLQKFITNIFTANLSSNSRIIESIRFKKALKECIQSFNQLMVDINIIIRDPKQFKSKYEYYLRDITMGLSRLICAALLLEQYQKSLENFDLEILLRWVNLQPIYSTDQSINFKLQKDISMDRQQNGTFNGIGDKDNYGNIRPKF